MKAVLDTNILIDYLKGVEKARRELSRYSRVLVSVITRIELLVGARDESEAGVIRDLLGSFDEVALTRTIAERAILIRKEHGMKIPDAIVYATAKESECLIVSRNSRDFHPDWPDVRMPYRL